MVTITSYNYIYKIYDLVGLSSDQKPTEINGNEITNGSTYYVMDTGNAFIFDGANKIWREV